jgi:hypothetical protein
MLAQNIKMVIPASSKNWACTQRKAYEQQYLETRGTVARKVLLNERRHGPDRVSRRLI